MRIAAGFTTNMIANMRKEKNISMETLVHICEILNCGIWDVIELEQDENNYYFCSRALEMGYTMVEVVNHAGQASEQITAIYMNTNREKMKEKANML